jgi:hypothetical protein
MGVKNYVLKQSKEIVRGIMISVLNVSLDSNEPNHEPNHFQTSV